MPGIFIGQSSYSSGTSGTSGVSGICGTTGVSGSSGTSGIDGTFFGTSELSNSYGGHNIAVGYKSMLRHTSEGVNNYSLSDISGFGGVKTSGTGTYALSSIRTF